MESLAHPGCRLLAARERRRLTQRDLAEQLSLKDPASISAIETGKDEPSLELALRIQVFFGGEVLASELRPDLKDLIDAATAAAPRLAESATA